MRRHTLVCLLSVTALLAACGGDDTTSDDGDAASGSASAASADDAANEDAADDVAASAEELVEEMESQQESQGGGGATVTIDGETWEFDSVLCAFGEEEIGQEGAEVVVSSIQDGLQFYVSIDSFGHSVSLNDVEVFEDPAVSLMSVGDDFIEVDDRSVSGQMTMMDDLTMEEFEGSFEGVCP